MAYVWIAGKARETPGSYELRAPWDAELLGSVGLADFALADEAIGHAQRAFAHTSRLSSHRRRDLLRAIAASLRERKDSLADTLAREAGKPITLARAEVDRAAQTFSLGAEESTRLGGELLSLDHSEASEGLTGVVRRVAAGPVLAITPFNFPLNLVAHKLAPAFAAGATVVLKPAPQTPRTALALAQIVRDSGAPEGMLSVLPCDVSVADAMVRDPRFAVVSFTGSASVGWTLRDRAHKKRVLLELGGNAAAIVCPDADLDHALNRIIPGAFAYAGQVCIKVQRVFVHVSRATELTEGLVERARGLFVRDPMDPQSLCASMIDEAAATRVRRWLDEAKNAGAECRVGGERSGNRVSPAVVLGAGEGMKLYDEEVFGPVLTVHSYTSLKDCIEVINRGRYGLQAGIFTHDLRAVSEVFQGLAVGALVVNDAPTLRADAMPYGGVKDSGLGREGLRYAIEEITERRLLLTRGLFG